MKGQGGNRAASKLCSLFLEPKKQAGLTGNCKLSRLSHFLQSTMDTVATTI